LSPYAKLVLSLGMITGRLEIWPVIILFSWRSWKKT
jgi:trk system potassium uptake protein TrkH